MGFRVVCSLIFGCHARVINETTDVISAQLSRITEGDGMHTVTEFVVSESTIGA